MDLTQLANLGEFIGGIGSLIGAIAVLATLIYLARQIQQNTAAVRAGTAQAFGESINGVNYLVAGGLEQARVWRIAMEDPSALSEDERTSADWMMLAACTTFDTALLQAELGSLDTQTDEKIRAVIRQAFAMERFRRCWALSPFAFTDRFVDFVESECGLERDRES